MKAADFVLIFLVSLSTLAYAQPPKTSDHSTDQAEIKRLISEIGRAYVSRDFEPFERIYLEHYISVRGKPVYNTKAQLIAMMKADSGPRKAGKKLDFETLAYETENPQIRFFDKTAIVTSLKKNQWRYRDSKCLTRSNATEVWLKRNGSWRLAAGHSTVFQCDPMPWQPIHPAVAEIVSKTQPPVNSDIKAESEIRAVISEIGASRSNEADSFAAINRHFADGYVATNVKGEIVSDRPPLLGALQNESGRGRGRSREEVVIQIIDNTGICTFRRKETNGTVLLHTIILVRMEGRWLIVASHTSKAGAA